MDDRLALRPALYGDGRTGHSRFLGLGDDLPGAGIFGLTSYFSASGPHEVLDERNAVYGKPLLSHEIGIHGTYIDLSLEERYRGTRIGDTEFMSSVRRPVTERTADAQERMRS